MNGYEFTVVQELYKEGVDKDGAPYVEMVL